MPRKKVASSENTAPKKRGRPAKSYELSSDAAFAKITKGKNLKRLSKDDLSRYKKEAYAAAKSVRDKAKREGKTSANKEIRELRKKEREQLAKEKADRKEKRELNKKLKEEKDKVKNKVKGMRSIADKFEDAMSNPKGEAAKQIAGNRNTRTAYAIYNEAIKSLFGQATKTGVEAKKASSLARFAASKGIGGVKQTGSSSLISQKVLESLGGKRVVNGKKVTVRASAFRAVLKVARSESTLKNVENAIIGVGKKKGYDFTGEGIVNDLTRRAIGRTVADIASGKYGGKSGGRFVTKKGSGIAQYVIKSAKSLADSYTYKPRPRKKK
jgi:hypothetical protein